MSQELKPEGFYSVNSPKKESRSFCPYFNLIEVCAQLAGIEDLAKKKGYCGYEVTHVQSAKIHEPDPVFKDMSLFDRNGYIMVPESTCRKVSSRLNRLVEFAQQKINIPNEQELEKAIYSKSTLSKRADELMKYQNILKNKVEQIDLINKWKKVIFKIARIPFSETENIPHFTKTVKPEDISKEEAIKFALTFSDSLKSIVGKYDDKDIKFLKIAQNCPKSPQFEVHPIFPEPVDVGLLMGHNA